MEIKNLRNGAIIIGAVATAIGVTSNEAQAQTFVEGNSVFRELPTINFRSSDGNSCSWGRGSQSTFNVGTSYDAQGQLIAKAGFVIPLGRNDNSCQPLVALEVKKSKLRYLIELAEYGVIDKAEFDAQVEKYKLKELA